MEDIEEIVKNHLIGKKLGPYIVTRFIRGGGMAGVCDSWEDPLETVRQDVKNGKRPDVLAHILAKNLGETVDVNMYSKEQIITRLNEHSEKIAQKLTKLSPDNQKTAYEVLLKQIGMKRNVKECRRALKILDPALLFHKNQSLEEKVRNVERFKQEVKAQSRLEHENVVKVYEAGEARLVAGGKKLIPLHYAAIEYVDIARQLNQGKFKDLREAVKVSYDALKGIIAVHERGMVHRDIKPHNILYAKDGTVKVSDFGLAKATDTGSSMTVKDLTDTGQVLGTPSYIAPELVRGEKASTSSDMYSFGATMYHFFTGQPPVETKGGVMEVLGEIGRKEDTAAWLREKRPEASKDVERFVMQLLAKDPKDRLNPYEAIHDLEIIMKRDLAEEKDISPEEKKKSEKQRQQSIYGLSREVKKRRSGNNHFRIIGGLYERLGNLHSEDTEQEINARIDAYEAAKSNYESAGMNNKAERLRKEIAYEHRRIRHLNKTRPDDTKIRRIVKKPFNFKKAVSIAGISAAALGMLAFGINTVYQSSQRESRQSNIEERIRASMANVEKAFERDDYNTARKHIQVAAREAVDLPQSHELSQIIRNARFNLVNEHVEHAVNAAEEKEYELAHKYISTAEKDAQDFPQSSPLWKTIENAKVEIGNHENFDEAGKLFVELKTLIESREYANANNSITKIREHIEKIKPHTEEFDNQVKALEAEIGAKEAEISKYKADIEVYNSLVTQYTGIHDKYKKLDEGLEKNEFFKQAEVDGMNEQLDGILSKLKDPITVKPEAVGEKKLEDQIKLAEEEQKRLPSLKKKLNERVVDYFTEQEIVVSETIDEIVDYTLPEVPAKLKEARKALTAAEMQYGNIDPIPEEIKTAYEQMKAHGKKLKDLESKADTYAMLVKQAAEGNAQEKKDANAGLAHTYIGFGRLDEAEKCLNAVTDKTGLENYIKIIELEKKLKDPAQHVKVPSAAGADPEVVARYSNLVEEYKKGNPRAEQVMESYLHVFSDKTKIEVKPAIDQLRSLSSLKGKELEDKKNTLYATLTKYAEMAKASIDKTSVSGPNPELILELSKAYQAAGYTELAKAVPDRFK